MKAIKSKNRLAKLMLVPGTLALTAAGAFAQDTDLWDTAQTKVTAATTSLTAFLGVMILIPLAFFAYKLVRRAF